MVKKYRINGNFLMTEPGTPTLRKNIYTDAK